MNLDQHQTALVQTPVGTGLAALLNGGGASRFGRLDESADRLVAQLPQGVKGTSPLGDTQVARGLKELSAACDAASKPAPWRDNLTVPEPPSHNVRNLAVGISGGAVAGVLACVLALNYMRNATAEHSPPSVSQTVTPIDVKAQETAEKKSAEDRQAGSGALQAPQGRGALPVESTSTPRLKSRLDPEVLFRLELSLEQAARIRTILERCSKDLPFAEEQIRGLLTEEQNRRWQSIAP